VTLTEAFEDQAISCTGLGSPFMGQLLSMLARIWPEQTQLGRYFASFDGDIGPAGASLPLRIGGGLHALVLTGKAPDLVAVYPPNDRTDSALQSAVLAALSEHETFLLDWVKSPPQTNEVRRSTALIPAMAVLRQHTPLPVCLSELGASAGLNMMWDRFALELPGARLGAAEPVLTLQPTWDGPLPPLTMPVVKERAGVDLNPLSPADPDDLLRLTAYLWPDQPERLTLTKAAATVADFTLTRGDAIDWLAQRLENAPDAHVHVIQHTVAWQYFPIEAQDRGRALIEAAGAEATPERPLAWLSLESDGDTKGAIGAALTLRIWPGDVTLHLGRADFHGRWVKWAGAC
jgi:hypothetical protein